MLKVQLPTYVDVAIDDVTMKRIAASYIRANLLGLSSGHEIFPDPIIRSKDGKEFLDPTKNDGFYKGGEPVGSTENEDIAVLVSALVLIEKGEKIT